MCHCIMWLLHVVRGENITFAVLEWGCALYTCMRALGRYISVWGWLLYVQACRQFVGCTKCVCTGETVLCITLLLYNIMHNYTHSLSISTHSTDTLFLLWGALSASPLTIWLFFVCFYVIIFKQNCSCTATSINIMHNIATIYAYLNGFYIA